MELKMSVPAFHHRKGVPFLVHLKLGELEISEKTVKHQFH
jgi:hypothetical protein